MYTIYNIIARINCFALPFFCFYFQFYVLATFAQQRHLTITTIISQTSFCTAPTLFSSIKKAIFRKNERWLEISKTNCNRKKTELMSSTQDDVWKKFLTSFTYMLNVLYMCILVVQQYKNSSLQFYLARLFSAQRYTFFYRPKLELFVKVLTEML